MHLSSSTFRRAPRHVVQVLAIGITLSLSPLLPSSTPLRADAPTASVTGLARGARGDAVRTLQQALVSQGVAVTGGVDGIFGPGTEAALKEFQRASGLGVSGVVDDATALALGLASSEVMGLAQGVRGDAVRLLQERLISAGIRPAGGADGIFGSATAAALRQFQSGKGLPATGVVDAATAAALGAVTASSGSGGGEGSSGSSAAPQQADPATAELVGLKIGSRGATVKRMQQMLLDAGFNVVGGADGIFGVLTASALSSFQTARGLRADAIVDQETATALAEAKPPSGSASGGGAASSPLVGLRFGATGSTVKELQRGLLAAGITVRGGADGIFGPATLAALKQFQTARALDASGVVDDATAVALATTAPQGAAKPNPLVGLRAGALGSTVKELQQALLDAGVKVRGGADGIFGPATSNALKEFQTSQGLEVTGVVDAATVQALANPTAPAAPVTAAGGYAEYGEKGQRVLSLQAALVRAGIAVRGGVDGDFGAGTSAAVMDFQRREGLQVTGKVTDATAAALGLSKEEAPTPPDPSTVQLQVFPVQGKCSYGDSWGFTRSGGRTHQGVDIIAPEGKLLYAAAEGRITKVYHDYPGSLAGNGLRITTADGTYFFYAHMSAIADGIDIGVPVKAGQIVGYVGNTGNSGTSHLHFEVHPQGGSAVNPYPLVKAIDGCGITEPLPQP